MTTVSTLLHSIALCACLFLQAVPGSNERPSGIRRALKTLSTQQADMPGAVPGLERTVENRPW